MEQARPAAHAVPQPPQLPGSVFVSTQTPRHSVRGAWQPQVPFKQVVLPPHAFGQDPQ
jgi:hypothetical protein